MIHALHELRQAGYTIALDDFVLTEENLPLVSHAHIIKLDFLLSKPNERREMLARLAGRHLKFLAEKAEDEAMVQEAMELALIRQKKVA